MLIRAYAEEAGHQVIVVDNGQKAVDFFEKDRPDLVIMDVAMPVKDGIEATKDIRKLTDKKNDWVPIIFLSAMRESNDIARGIDAGGDDYLTKPIDAAVLTAKLRAMGRISDMRHELHKLNRDLRMMAVKDGLTGISNRRHFDESMIKELKRSTRTKTPLSLILCDVDHFKQFNDNYGHQVGDVCLKTIAEALQKITNRTGDLVARYGGEEFAFVLPETDLQGAEKLAESVRSAVEALAIPHAYSSVAKHVTLSFGVASVQPQKGQSIEIIIHDLIEVADEALYDAKSQGRNQVVVISEHHQQKRGIAASF